MQVATYYNNSDIRIEELPQPEAGANELVVKVMASGICGSDVLEWYRIKKAPLVLGHEITGIISAVGDGVQNLQPGDRVFVSHHVPCNTCHYCLRGHHTACNTLQTSNYYPGGFAEYIRVPPLNVDRGVFILPEDISFEDGVFIEPLACVVRGQRLADVQPGQCVLILGSGISGLLHLLLARVSGVGRIFASDIHEFRLDTARNFGADTVFHAGEDIPKMLEKKNKRLADLVIVCTGAASAFEQAFESVDRGGTILFFASPDPGVKVDFPVNQFWRNSIRCLTSYGNSPLDAEIAIELIRSRRVRVQPMITHRFPLAQTAMGFKLTADGSDSLKIIIEPQRK